MTTARSEDLNRVLNDALIDTQAQSVLKHLKANQSNRRRALGRWIWELLQNARDTSTGAGDIVASILHEDGYLVFQHTGRPFTLKEVAHLIFHGSTKTEDPTQLGQYGSGFLTTHVLSPEIEVSGRLDDDRAFQFTMRRDVGSVEALSESMHRAWGAFGDSLSATRASREFMTRFRYPLTEESADAVEKGLDILRGCAPLVICFNPAFARIEERTAGTRTSFSSAGRQRVGEEDGLSLASVLGGPDGEQTQVDYLVKSQGRTAVAVLIERAGETRTCASPTGVPKLFLGFPLVGTEAFAFPAVINSFDFTPTEDRDGVYLAQGEDDANDANERVVVEACGLTVDLIRHAASQGWRNAHAMAKVPKLASQQWLGTDWLRDVLQERFVECVRKCPSVVRGPGGDPLPPSEARLPVAKTEDGVGQLWELLADVQELRLLLPKREDAFGWTDAVNSWSAMQSGSGQATSTEFGEVVDGHTLASMIDRLKPEGEWATLGDLEKLLRDGVAPLDWLDRFHQFLLADERHAALEDFRLVPDQSGYLDCLSGLHRDCGIDDQLKGIAKLLEWAIEQDLRDAHLSTLRHEEGAGDWSNDNVSRDLVKAVQQAATESNERFAPASSRLFGWLARKGDWEQLRGFPVFAPAAEAEEDVTVIYTSRTPGVDEAPLAPVSTWPEDLRPFAGIFPPSLIMRVDFFEALPDLQVWGQLENEALVRRNVMRQRTVNLRQAVLRDPLPEEDHEHESANLIEVTDVVHRTDVMERVRASRDRGLLYWRFVMEWLLKHDADGLDVQAVSCECQDTHYCYRAVWLESLREDKWIRLEGRRYGVGPESLAKLLRGGGERAPEYVQGPMTRRLLDAIGVSRLALMHELYAETEEEQEQLATTVVDILASSEGDVGRLEHAREYIDALREHEDLPDELARWRERKRVTQANHALGDHVEKLVKESLEAEGYEVRRTGVGSDFEIEDVTRLTLRSGRRTWLVEVKATRDQQGVRLTATQAKEAMKKRNRFLLCVVEVTSEGPELGEVRDSMRFVASIGDDVAPLCGDLDELEGLRSDVTGRANKSPGLRLEIASGVARIRVAASVWEKGFGLEELVDRLAAR